MSISRASQIFFAGLFIASLSNGAYAEERSKTYVSVVEGSNLTIEVVPYPDKADHYLMHFEGFGGKYDDKTLLYVKDWKSSSRTQGYKMRVAGFGGVHLESWGGEILQATVGNSEGFRVIYGYDVDVVKERRIRADYLERQGLTDSKIAAKKLIKAGKQDFESSCGHSLDVKVAWDEFSDSADKTTPGMMKAYLNSLKAICAIDEDYKGAVHTISQVSVYKAEPGEGHKVTLDSNTLSIHLDKEMPNVTETSYYAIQDVL